MAGVIAVVAGAALGLGAFFLNQLPPMANWLQYTTFRILPNTLPDVEEQVRALYRGDIDGEKYAANMRRLGYNVENATQIFKNAQSLLNLNDLVVLWWREEITDLELKEKCYRLGFTDEEVELFKVRSQFYPSPRDLVRWQAREVYEPYAVSKYGLDDEFELLDLEAFTKAGMTKEQVRNFWRAHWEHPSWTQISEMLFRTDLTEDDVWEWFRLIEVPPYWRDRFIKIAYRPFTRVDVRRMYRVGTLDRSDLTRAYMDLGYDEEKAASMTDFTIKYEGGISDQGGKDLTRTMLEKGYELGLLTRNQALEGLMSLSYDENEAEFIIALQDEEKLQDHIDDQIDLIEKQIIDGVLTATEAGGELANLGLTGAKIELLINRALEKRKQTVQLPSKADIKSWLKHGIVDQRVAREYLERLRYKPETINLYIADWKGGPEREEKAAEAGRETGG